MRSFFRLIRKHPVLPIDGRICRAFSERVEERRYGVSQIETMPGTWLSAMRETHLNYPLRHPPKMRSDEIPVRLRRGAVSDAPELSLKKTKLPQTQLLYRQNNPSAVTVCTRKFRQKGKKRRERLRRQRRTAFIGGNGRVRRFSGHTMLPATEKNLPVVCLLHLRYG
jgi:hypothetical protein